MLYAYAICIFLIRSDALKAMLGINVSLELDEVPRGVADDAPNQTFQKIMQKITDELLVKRQMGPYLHGFLQE